MINWNEYVDELTKCPHCGKYEVELDVGEPDDQCVYVECKCYECDEEWRLEFLLSLIIVENPEQEFVWTAPFPSDSEIRAHGWHKND